MLQADFTLLFLQNEDILHTKQHTQEQYVSDLSIDIIFKTKKCKIHYKKCPKNVLTDRQTHTQEDYCNPPPTLGLIIHVHAQ